MEKLTASEVADMIVQDLKGKPPGWSSSMYLDQYQWPSSVAIKQKLQDHYQMNVRVIYTDNEILYTLLSY